ncbi:MAG: isomerizing glutamine--fructose-6-phosphate transaminase [Candidatus Nitrosocaldus sp.]
MCSIIAYKGYRDAAPLMVKALSRMEYRGYDSVGIATAHNSALIVKKGVGNVSYVNARLNLDSMQGNAGIGHTRWATHGAVNDNNAHPHVSCNGRIAVVHNGLVENHDELRFMLSKEGHVFKSETDSEVIAHLLESLPTTMDDMRHGYDSMDKAITDMLSMLNGSYSFVALTSNGMLLGARYHEPLIIGLGNPSRSKGGGDDDNNNDSNGDDDDDDYMLLVDECFIASDVLAFIEYTDKAIFLADGEVFVVRGITEACKPRLSIEIYNSRDGKAIVKEVTQIAWEFADVDKGRFAHYTLKEIHEQGHAISRAFFNADPKRLHLLVDALIDADRITITGSGSSYHAALMAKYLFSKICMLRCDAIVASEFTYNIDTYVGNGSPILFAVSQSGETADVLNAVRIARDNNFKKIASIVNSPLSTLARESDIFLSINAGPEVGVAATKSFTAQIALLYRISMEVARSKGINPPTLDIESSSINVEKMLEREAVISDLAESIKNANSIYIIAKGMHHVIALECALKLKELAYIHAEGIHAGELKHGPLALIDEKSIVIALNPMDDTYSDVITSVHEAKARGAYIIGVSDSKSSSSIYDFTLTIPRVDRLLYPLYEVIPLQLLAYHMALKRDCNPDYPRNIAKSVTVK